MEDQWYHFTSSFLLVCFVGSALGESRRDMSCSSSPFAVRSHNSFLAKETTTPGDTCKVESGKLSGLTCLSETSVLTARWKGTEFMLPQEKPSDATESNKSKATSHSKISIKKHTNSKKLKGSKSQRKKKKKKKLGKKKKTR